MRVLLLVIGGVVWPSLAAAQYARPAAARPLQVTLDLGFVDAAGNSDVTSFNLGEKLGYRLDSWVFTQTLKVIYGETSGARTAESYEAGARAQYDYTRGVAAFAQLSFQRDPFAGMAARWSGGPGVALGAIRTARDTVTVEAAFTGQRERSTAGTTQAFVAARSAALFKHLFGAAAFATQSLEWVANLETTDDHRVTSETALTAPLSRQVALRMAYLVRFDNVPEPGFERTDRILTTGVQIAL